MDRYRHIKTGKEYTVTGGTRLVQVNGEWKEHIDYFSDDCDLPFSREIEDFHAKFEIIVSLDGRHLYNELKKRKISTASVNLVLKMVGINISDRTLQNYLDSNMKSCKNPQIIEIIQKMISNYDSTINEFKK